MPMSYYLVRVLDFYGLLVFAYVIFSWFRPTGLLYDIYRVLEQICEPYVGLFRRIVPALGGIDFSPWVAILFLRYIIQPVLVTILGRLGI
jgi:uncharacterized protein YggT (Ycf19 family)